MNYLGIYVGLGAAFLLLILIYRLRKKIRLLIIRIVYGHYSYEYLRTYKKFYIRSPFQYCFRDDFIAHLIFVLSKKEDSPSYKSHKDIYFENTPYFTKYKDFLKQRGNPDCFNAYLFGNLKFEIKAVGYNSLIAGSKVVIVFYFMNNVFFMGEYIFKNPKTDVKANLVNHFLENNELPFDNFYIENSKNRIIHFQDTGFTVDIKYLNKEDQVIVDNLKEYYNIVTGKKLVMKL